MLSEVDFAGILFAPIVLYALAALPVTLAIRFVLLQIGFARLVWHFVLFEFALYLSVLSLLVLLL